MLYDPDATEAGDDENLGHPHLAVLDTTGVVEDIRLPVVEGILAIAEERLVLPPRAAVGPAGDLYVETATAVLRVTADGETVRIAGTDTQPGNYQQPPQRSMGELPRDALSVDLPVLSGLVVADDGTVSIATETSLLAVSPDGILSLVADPKTTADDGDGAIRVPTEGNEVGGSYFTGLAIDSDGSVLVGDTGELRILRISESGSEVLLRDVAFIGSGNNVARAPTADLLIVRSGDTLVAYGR